MDNDAPAIDGDDHRVEPQVKRRYQKRVSNGAGRKITGRVRKLKITPGHQYEDIDPLPME